MALDQITDEVARAAELVTGERSGGVIFGYHATLIDPETAQSEGLLPRSSGRTLTVWEGLEVDPYVSEDHVYFFQHEADAATYFDNHKLPKDMQAREQAAVYSAHLSVDRLDIDPEDLAEYLSYAGTNIPIDMSLSLGGEMSSEDAVIYRAGNAILAELHVAFVAAGFTNTERKYSPEHVAKAWQLYERLPEVKRQVLVAACLYGSPNHAVRLMHRGPIRELRYEDMATEFARLDLNERYEHEGKYERYVRHRIAEQVWPIRRESEFYKGLTSHRERMAFRECAWIENEAALREEIDRRVESHAFGERARANMRQRRIDRLGPDPTLEQLQRIADIDAESERLTQQRIAEETAWLAEPLESERPKLGALQRQAAPVEAPGALPVDRDH